MKDPALKNSLSAEDIEYLTRSADFQVVRKTTAWLTPLSGGDILVIWGAVFLISMILHIDLNIRPFLPFKLPSAVAPFIALLFYTTVGVGLIGLLGILANIVSGAGSAVWRKLFPRQPFVTCPRCATRNQLKHYLQGQSCSKCKSRLVYCARCGKSSEIENFLSGSGCPHCTHERFSASW
jgi:hypothetical protein